MYKEWVLDATNSDGKPPFVFCPIDDDGEVVFGMNYLSDKPPGMLTGVVHLGGEDAVIKWCETHAEALEEITSE